METNTMKTRSTTSLVSRMRMGSGLLQEFYTEKTIKMTGIFLQGDFRF